MSRTRFWLMIGVVVALVSAFAMAYRWGSCEWYGYQTDREVKVAPFLGCLIKSGDHWIPRSEIRPTVN